MMQETRREFLKKLGLVAGSSSVISILPGTESTGQITGAARTINPSELCFDSATEAARAIRKRQVSSVELTKHILKRIDQYNPSLNAIVTLIRDEALSKAHTADEALAKGQYLGPLHGVPITIKDAFEMASVRTTAGALRLADYIPKTDAVVVSRLRTAGAVILGHTNVPFMLGDWQSYNKIFGTTNNPWDLKRTPGGSTGGGAAALAAGLSYLSVGSDIGGSIRIPAHFCGLYGHKPTLGLIPEQGHIPPSPEFHPWPPHDLAVSGKICGISERLPTFRSIEKKSYSTLGSPRTQTIALYYRHVKIR